MREMDGIRIAGPLDGKFTAHATSKSRELIGADETGDRWRLGEVTAEPDEAVATHLHPGESEALVVLEGEVELHGASGITLLHPGDVVFVPPDTEHGLRTPNGGRWLAIWPIKDRVPGHRYGSKGIGD